MRDECIELQQQIDKLEKKKLKKEPLEVIEAYKQLSDCFFKTKNQFHGFEICLRILYIINNHKERKSIINSLDLTFFLSIFQKIIENIDNNNHKLKSEEVDTILELLDLLWEDNENNTRNQFSIAEIQFYLYDKLYNYGFIEKQVYQVLIKKILDYTEELYQKGLKRLEKIEFDKAQHIFSMAAILFQMISDPKMDIAFRECAKANLLQGKYLISKKKFIQGLESIIEAIKIFQIIEMYDESDNALIVFHNSLKISYEYFEKNDVKEDLGVKKLIFFDEIYKELKKNQKKANKIQIDEISDQEGSYLRIPYPKSLVNIDENSSKDLLLREKYTLEESLEKIVEAFRDGMISSEDYARLLLGLNRNIYKVKILLEKKNWRIEKKW